MSNKADWNPTIVTRDGDPISVESSQPPRHKRRGELKRLCEQDYTIGELVDELDASKSAIYRQLDRYDLKPATKGGDYDTDLITRLHEEGDVPWRVETDGGEAEDDDGGLRCPDCGRFCGDEAQQHDCMRRHASAAADELVAKAKGGFEVLHR